MSKNRLLALLLLPVLGCVSAPATNAELDNETFNRTYAGVLRTGGDVKPPVMIPAGPERASPEEVRVARIPGVVILDVAFDKSGVVRDAVVLQGQPDLSEAALVKVRRWKFLPATLNGEPVDVVHTLTVKFESRAQYD